MIPRAGEVKDLLKLLGYTEEHAAEASRQIEHFEREAPVRDEIVEDYFDRRCILRIASEIVKELEVLNREKITLLDVGAGSGTFTVRVADMLKERGWKVEAYGLDITPGMLMMLARKGIVPVWGVAEKIESSILLINKLYGLNIPLRFDAVISTFTLHHIPDPRSALVSMKKVVLKNGRVIVVDVVRYGEHTLKDRLADVHPGLLPEEVRRWASRIFDRVKVEIMEGVRCIIEGVEVKVFKGVFE